MKFEESIRPQEEILFKCRRKQLNYENKKAGTNKWKLKTKKYYRSATIKVMRKREEEHSMIQEAFSRDWKYNYSPSNIFRQNLTLPGTT